MKDLLAMTITAGIFLFAGSAIYYGIAGQDGISQYNQKVKRNNAIRKEYVYQCVKGGRSSNDCHTLCDTECKLEALK